jgi:hypothetical protein
MLIKTKFEGYCPAGIRLYPMGGGDSAPAQPTNTSVSQTSIPEYAKPYVENMLGKTEALGNQPYQTYGEERQAGFTPEQQTAFQNAYGMQTSGQTGAATDMASQAGLGALNTSYQGNQFASQFQAPGQYDPAQVSMYEASAPNLQNYQMGPAQQVGTQSFAAPGSSDAYMSPYMQSVVDVQQREAGRQADIATTGRNAAAVGSGAFGGSRQAIMDAEAARNLATRKSDIQATGSQAAYQQAQQQFNTEQAAGLQAQQANQQAGLSTGQNNLNAQLGIQQLGSGQSMQAQLANQQALQNAQSLAEQSRQYGAGYGMTGAQTAAQYGQSAAQLGEQSSQYGAGLEMQGNQTALSAAGQLGQLGQNEYAQNLGINQLQQATGATEQAQQQAALTQQYNDFMAQKQYPYQQLSYMSDMLRGLPMSQSTNSLFQAPVSTAATVAGLGAAAYGASKMAKGGKVKEKQRPAGLAELAISKMA